MLILDEKVKFLKLLANATIQSEITNQLKASYFIPEHQLFLVDLDCLESHTILEKVRNVYAFITNLV